MRSRYLVGCPLRCFRSGCFRGSVVTVSGRPVDYPPPRTVNRLRKAQFPSLRASRGRVVGHPAVIGHIAQTDVLRTRVGPAAAGSRENLFAQEQVGHRLVTELSAAVMPQQGRTTPPSTLTCTDSSCAAPVEPRQHPVLVSTDQKVGGSNPSRRTWVGPGPSGLRSGGEDVPLRLLQVTRCEVDHDGVETRRPSGRRRGRGAGTGAAAHSPRRESRRGRAPCPRPGWSGQVQHVRPGAAFSGRGAAVLSQAVSASVSGPSGSLASSSRARRRSRRNSWLSPFTSSGESSERIISWPRIEMGSIASCIWTPAAVR
jgi:hypothetical protein